jgi:hypothetical protein
MADNDKDVPIKEQEDGSVLAKIEHEEHFEDDEKEVKQASDESDEDEPDVDLLSLFFSPLKISSAETPTVLNTLSIIFDKSCSVRTTTLCFFIIINSRTYK